MPEDSEVFITIGGVEAESIVDGPGFRYVVFVQGCRFACPGCHNPQLQPFSGGRRVPVAELLGGLKANALLDGLTLSGGEPFTQALPCAVLAEQARAAGFSVMTYTGYRWEDLWPSGRVEWRRLVEATDILVDGPFMRERRNLDLRFRGSSNQRLIDVRRSLRENKAVELPEDFEL